MNVFSLVCLAALSSLSSQNDYYSPKHYNTKSNTKSVSRFRLTSLEINQVPSSGTEKSSEDLYFFPQPVSIELKTSETGEWIIWVNGQAILAFPSLIEALTTLMHFNLYLQRPDLNANQIQPAVINGQFSGQLGTATLFTVPASGLPNPPLTLIQSVNNLRVAMGAEPLTLLQAQKQMYGLTESNHSLEGMASWYGPYFQGRLTASGERFEQQDFTAAHPNLPFNTYLEVTNLKNNQSVVVRINDRGPYIHSRMLDLSYAAATQIASDEAGVVPVQATVLLKE